MDYCLVCKSKDYNIIFNYDSPDQYEMAVGVKNENYNRKWVKCKKCNFCYSIYSRDKKIINKIYQNSYRSVNSSWRKQSPEESFEKIIKLPDNESETKLRVDWIKKNITSIWESGILKPNNPPFNLLDIGGGNGVFAYMFWEGDKNWVSHVIDPDENADFIDSKFQIPFIKGYYSPNKFNKKFDLISLIYILEHLTDPISFLKSVKKDMNSNAFLYIEVPDVLSFKYKDKIDDIFNSCHLWMFDPNNLIRLLNECGFQVFCLNRIKTKRGHYALMLLTGKK